MKRAVRPRQYLFPAGCLLAACFVALRTNAASGDEPSVAWQPSDANGAEGTGFTVTMRAAPTDLAAEDPLTLTVHIAATGAWQRPPQRPALSRLKEFKGFDFTPNASEGPDRAIPAEHAWEFDYRLRPLSAEVKKIPGIAFRYYNPRIALADRRWQTTFADPVPLTVRPRTRLTARDVQGPRTSPKLPAAIYRFARGPSLLRSEPPYSLPGTFTLLLLLLVPPAACVGGCVLWCRLHPQALRRRQRHSRAARQALQALDGLIDHNAQAFGAADIVSAYLRQRLEMPPGDLTPGEVAEALQDAGYPRPLAAQGENFFRACDAARFAPHGDKSAEELPTAAARLIRSLEEEHS